MDDDDGGTYICVYNRSIYRNLCEVYTLAYRGKHSLLVTRRRVRGELRTGWVVMCCAVETRGERPAHSFILEIGYARAELREITIDMGQLIWHID